MTRFYIKFLLLFMVLSFHMCSSEVAAQKNGRKIREEKEKHAQTPKNNTGLLIDAKKESLLGNTKEAYRMLQSYVERYPGDPVGLYELARIEANETRYSQAIRHMVTAVSLDPGNLWYRLFLAELYQLTGDYKPAQALYEQVVRDHPENPEYMFQLAALYLASGKLRDAVEVYDQIEQVAGISEELIIQKQKIYMHLREPGKAEAELQKLTAAFPLESRYYSILAEFYISSDKPEKALATYLKIAEIDPDNAYIHMSLADYYRKAGNRQKSYEELKLGFGNPNLDIDTKIAILLSFYSINQLYSDLKDEAFELTNLLIETHPGDPKAYSILGDLLTQDKQYQPAKEAFLNVISIDSSRYAIWEELLRLSLLTEDYEGLSGYARRVTALFPEQPVPFLFQGLAHLQLKQYQESIQALKRGLNLVVDNDELLAQFYMYLGDAHHSTQENELSDSYYDKSLVIKPNNAYVLNNYAYYLSLRGIQLEKAEKMARQAVALDPENSSFLDTYGWVLYKLGRYEEARQWIEKAIQKDAGASGEVLEHLGDVYFRLGDLENALTCWNKAKMKGDASEFIDKKIKEKRIIGNP